MNRRFIAEVLKLAPDLSVVGHYFYMKPVDHIMGGFLCERPSTTAFFWKYAFPLYVPFNFLHLGFGDRLPRPEGIMPVKRGPGMAKEVAKEFVKRIEPYKAEMRETTMSFDRFAACVEREIGLENRGILRGYAYTLLLMGREEEARAHLESIVGSEESKEFPKRYADVRIILNDLSKGTGKRRGKHFCAGNAIPGESWASSDTDKNYLQRR